MAEIQYAKKRTALCLLAVISISIISVCVFFLPADAAEIKAERPAETAVTPKQDCGHSQAPDLENEKNQAKKIDCCAGRKHFYNTDIAASDKIFLLPAFICFQKYTAEIDIFFHTSFNIYSSKFTPPKQALLQNFILRE